MPGARTLLQLAAERIQAAGPPYTSVYLYMLHGEDLVLEAFAGRETEHTRIPVGHGVCGTAVATGEDQNVGDVARHRELHRLQHVHPLRAGGADPSRRHHPGPDRRRQRRPDPFTPEEEAAVRQVADALAVLL